VRPFSVDPYLSRRYNLATQNCWHLVQDAWLELTGVDLGDRTPERITTAALLGRFDNDVPTFTLLDKPVSPCVALFRRPGMIPHVGVFYRGKILQMAVSGPSYVDPDVAKQGFHTLEYYR
jgi:hypothetical protein